MTVGRVGSRCAQLSHWVGGEFEEFRLASPATLGGATHCMAVPVENVDRHRERVRDNEGGLWSFMQPLPQTDGAAP